MSEERNTRAGFTLIEVMIASVILFVLAASIVESTSSLRRITVSGDVEGRLQNSAETAMSSIRSDLRRAGFVTANGKSYPHVFTGGSAGAGWTANDHTPETKTAAVGDSDYGPDREIVFVLPTFTTMKQGDDGVNYALDDDVGGATIVKTYAVPDIDASGAAIWSVSETSIVAVTRTDGVNALERRVDGVTTNVLARNVERVTFETPTQDPVNIPVGAVRVRLWLRDRDDRGTVHRYFTEAVIRLRNV